MELSNTAQEVIEPFSAPLYSRYLLVVALVSVPIALYGVSLLFDDSVGWMNHEYLIFSLPGALLNGIYLKWQDLFRGFDPLLFDAIRPRFLNYVITILNVKLRLLAYQLFIPPANLSIGLLTHLLLAPALFFVLASKLFQNRWAALLGTCLYVTSVGFLSSVAFFAQPGKNLIHVLTLVLFDSLASLHERENVRPFGEERTKIVMLVMLLNLVGISIDEQSLLVALVGAVLFYRLFLPVSLAVRDLVRSGRALTLYFGPFVAFFLFAAFAAPRISEKLGNGRCDFLAYFLQEAVARGEATPYWPFFYDLATTAIA